MLFSRSFSDAHRTTVFLRKHEEKDELAFGVALYFDIAENLKEVTRLLCTFHSAIPLVYHPHPLLKRKSQHYTSTAQVPQRVFPQNEKQLNVPTAGQYKAGHL